MSHLRADLN
uniref:Uncharacterized protein n=1 Tax=Anguilla anguilla TaxID=7936 RepID=A0A0E9W4R8_ANGAN